MSDIIDINVTPTIEEVTINTTQFLTTINVNTQSGGGAVDSVNGQTGIVVLDADDISDSGTTNKFVTSAEKTAITHTNRTILDAITEAFTTALKSTYDMAKSNIDALLLTGSRLITNSEITILSNTSGTNTGDNATNTTSNSYADAKVTDAIVDGVTTVAPSQNAVFDALALKVDIIFTDGVTATGAAVTTEQKLKSYLIPANRIADESNLLLNVRFVKISGGGGAYTLRAYVNTSDTLVGATLIGFYSQNIPSIQEIPLQRTIMIKGSNLIVLNTAVNTTNDLGVINTNPSLIAFNRAVNQYLIISVQSTANHIFQITMANLIKN